MLDLCPRCDGTGYDPEHMDTIEKSACCGALDRDGSCGTSSKCGGPVRYAEAEPVACELCTGRCRVPRNIAITYHITHQKEEERKDEHF